MVWHQAATSPVHWTALYSWLQISLEGYQFQPIYSTNRHLGCECPEHAEHPEGYCVWLRANYFFQKNMGYLMLNKLLSRASAPVLSVCETKAKLRRWLLQVFTKIRKIPTCAKASRKAMCFCRSAPNWILRAAKSAVLNLSENQMAGPATRGASGTCVSKCRS